MPEYPMSPRERKIEAFYLRVIANVLRAKEHEGKLYRHEITVLADRILALRAEIDCRKKVRR